MKDAINSTAPFSLRVFQQTGGVKMRGSLSGSFAELVDMKSLLEWDDGLLDAIKSTNNNYPVIFGSDKIRRLVADMLDLEADDIIITNGVDDAIPSIYSAIFKSGDRVLLLQPAYEPLVENAHTCGLSTHQITLAATKSGWQLSNEFLQLLRGGEMHGCVLNAPHYITGWFPTQSDLREITSFTEKTNGIVIADEVYAGLALHPQKPALPSLASLSERIISVGSLTKSFGLPGLRIGWIACKNKKIIESIKNRRTYGHCYTSALSELIACSALKNKETILQRNGKIARENLSALSTMISKYQSIFSAHPPNYGTVCLARFNPTNTAFDNAAELSAELMKKESIVLLHNEFFNLPQNCFRFGFATKKFGELLPVFESYLRKNIYKK